MLAIYGLGENTAVCVSSFPDSRKIDMDVVHNLKAFLAVARCGTFSEAARQEGLAISVMAKRVGQLEAAAGVVLFSRSTRRLILTDAGQRWIARAATAVEGIDALLDEARRPRRDLEGLLRVKAPTTLAALHVGDLLARFGYAHPKIEMDIVLADRALDPVAEAFDVAITVFESAYPGTRDVPLCPLKRVLCAAPAYLAARGVPAHPRDLAAHDVLCFRPKGDVWAFDSRHGQITVDVRPRVSSNDGQVLLAAARAGNGVALLSNYVAAPSLRAGTLVPVLEAFPVPDIWIKALVPERRAEIARVRALLDALAVHFQDPAWQEGAETR